MVSRRVRLAAAAALMVALVPWGSGAVSASSGTLIACGQWTQVASPNHGTDSSILSGVSAISSTNVWAVGNWFDGFAYRTLIEHWDGAAWSVVASPNVGTDTNDLGAVAALAADDVWAAGFYADSSGFRTLVEHWDGSTWTVVPTSNVGGDEDVLMSVTAVSPSDIWAVGYRSNASFVRRTLTEHWNGAGWTVVQGRNVGSDENLLYGVAASSSTDVWAVGFYSVPWAQTLVEHWNGVAWTVVPSPNRTAGSDNFLNGVVATGSSSAQAVGSWLRVKGNLTRTLAERWNGAAWAAIHSPNVGSNFNQLWGIAAAASNHMWAVGNRKDGVGTPNQTLIAHWDGTSWQAVSSPNVGTKPDNYLHSVGWVPGTPEFWAVGNYSNAKDHTLVEHWC